MALMRAFNAILNTSETSQVVCGTRPVGITEAAVFLVNTSKLRHQEDIRADDVGSWCHKGKPVRFYTVEECHLVKYIEFSVVTKEVRVPSN